MCVCVSRPVCTQRGHVLVGGGDSEGDKQKYSRHNRVAWRGGVQEDQLLLLLLRFSSVGQRDFFVLLELWNLHLWLRTEDRLQLPVRMPPNESGWLFVRTCAGRKL